MNAMAGKTPPPEPRGTVLRLISNELYDRCFPGPLQRELAGIARVDPPPPDAKKLPPDAWAALLRKYDVLLGGWGARGLPPGYRPERRQLWCQVTGSVAGQAVPEHLENGLRLTNWGDAISFTIAEAALTLLLACHRRLGVCYHNTHIEKGWRRPAEFHSLFERRVGLVGFGAIARALVPLLRPFRVKIAAYDPYVPDPVFAAHGVTRVPTLRALFENSDAISIHAAKTRETNNLITSELLRLLPDHGVIVNTGRGNILDELALAEEHRRGRLYSGLDVFDPEPPAPDHPLRDTPRCLITCHSAGPTTDMYPKMGRRAVENIGRFLRKQPLIQEITSEMLRRMT